MIDMSKENEINDQVFVGIFADDGRKFKSLFKEQGIFSEEEFDRYLRAANRLPELAYQ